MSQDESYKTMVEINADTYVNSWVTDLRQAVSQVAYPVTGKSIFYMVKYIDSGVFIIVLRTIPKTPGNHLAAWIYIPYSVRIPSRDLINTVEFIAAKVANTEVKPKDLNEINELFDHRYEEDLQSPVFPPSQGINYAYRFYGPRVSLKLEDLIGPYLYQTPYLPYAGVMLIDHDIANDVAGTNLTSAPIDDMAVLLPPDSPSEDGYTATIYGENFEFPYYVPMTRNIDIIWQKEGEADVKQTLYVVQSEMRAPNLKLQRHTTPSLNPVNQSLDSTASDSDIPSRKKTYHFQIPAKSAAIGTVIEFEITTNNELEDSPIDGYEPTETIQEGAGRNNHLLFKADSLKKRRITNAIWAAGGFIVGALLTLLCTCDRKPSEPAPAALPTDQVEVVETETVATTETAAATDNAKAEEKKTENAAATPGDTSLKSAIKYLDSNPIWQKAEMDKYPDLKGLYEDMNNIERKKLVEVWGPKLSESRAFTNQIVHHSKLSYKKTARRKPFNTPEEPQQIRIQSYLNNIDP